MPRSTVLLGVVVHVLGSLSLVFAWMAEMYTIMVVFILLYSVSAWAHWGLAKFERRHAREEMIEKVMES